MCELPKLEGTLRPQYLAGGRFSGPSLLFNAHRKQNRPTPDVRVANIITRACRDPSQGRAHELEPPRFGNASSAFKRHRLKPVHFDLAKGEASRRGTEKLNCSLNLSKVRFVLGLPR